MIVLSPSEISLLLMRVRPPHLSPALVRSCRLKCCWVLFVTNRRVSVVTVIVYPQLGDAEDSATAAKPTCFHSLWTWTDVVDGLLTENIFEQFNISQNSRRQHFKAEVNKIWHHLPFLLLYDSTLLLLQRDLSKVKVFIMQSGWFKIVIWL